jgi:2'-5' RNA ligase
MSSERSTPNNMQYIRTFIAISLTPELRTALDKMSTDLKPFAQGIRWVKPDSIHLTIKFLGNLSTDQLQEVFDGMEIAQKRFPEMFSVDVEGTGAFPSLRRPRVLWVGIKGEQMEKLRSLQGLIDSSLQKMGFPSENRKYSPHLTVARIKDGKQLGNLLERFSSYPFQSTKLPVDKISVMRSDLKPNGAVYTMQKTYNLKEV